MTRSASVVSLYADAEATFGIARKTRSRPPVTAVDQLVGDRIRRRRLELGFEQATVAAALDVTPLQLNSFESGAERIGAHRLQKLARLLDVPPAFFFNNGQLNLAPDSVSPYQEAHSRVASPTPNTQSPTENSAIESVDAQGEISRAISTKPFFEKYFQPHTKTIYPMSRLFSMFIPADSVVVDSSGRFFASGEALISVPAQTRHGAKVEASLSLPVHVSGKWRTETLSIEKAEVAPIESHFPPDLAQRLRAPPPRRRSRAAA